MTELMWGMKAKLKREAKQKPKPIIEKKVEQPKPKAVEVKKPIVKKVKKTKKTLKSIKSDYDDKKKAEDINKIIYNKTIAEIHLKDSNLKRGIALVLDSSAMLTFKALVSTGYPKSRIEEINYDKETYLKIKAKHKNTFYTSFGEHIKSAPQNSISSVVADYMCSLNGNDSVRPLDDLKSLFDGKKLMKGSFLAITLCSREKGNRDYKSLNELISELTKMSARNGYTFILLPQGRAYTGMYYIFCIIE